MYRRVVRAWQCGGIGLTPSRRQLLGAPPARCLACMQHPRQSSLGTAGLQGWNSELIPRDHFLDKVFVESKAGVCPFSMHTLYDAARRCGKYDWDEAEGGQQLPVFEVGRAGRRGALPQPAQPARLPITQPACKTSRPCCH